MDQDLTLKHGNSQKKAWAVVLHETDTERDFLNMTLFAPKLKPTTDNWDLIKFNRFYTSRETIG